MSIDLKSLCGGHLLSGVDMPQREVDRYGTKETVNACRFRLDGVTYVALEDPSDGYRSSMDELIAEEGPTTNEWPPVRVVCSMAPDGEYGQTNETLEIRDAVTGGIILRVGTDNSDDYYPWWVAEFSPAALAHNASKDQPAALAAPVEPAPQEGPPMDEGYARGFIEGHAVGAEWMREQAARLMSRSAITARSTADRLVQRQAIVDAIRSLPTSPPAPETYEVTNG